MKRKTLGATLVVLLMLGGGGYYEWRHGEAKGPEKAQSRPAAPVPVTLAAAERSDFPVYLSGLGTVQAYNTVAVRTRIDGQIEKISFKEGQLVKEGDLLVQIDPRPYQAALTQAQAKKAQDEANLKNAQLDLERYLKLGDYSTRQQKDTQAATVAQLTAQVSADQAALENATTQLGYTTVRAPITGVTSFRQVDVGNIVNAATQTGIVTIAQIEPISVVFTEPENQLGEINQALAAGPVEIDAYTTDRQKKLSEGKLEVVNNQVDPATGTIRLKAIYDNKDHALWPGLSVSTKTLVRTEKNVTTVPEDAIQHGPDGLYVYVVGPDGKARMQPVTSTQSGEGRVVVAKGLSEGERVITEGQYRVQPGVAVAEKGPGQRQASDESH